MNTSYFERDAEMAEVENVKCYLMISLSDGDGKSPSGSGNTAAWYGKGNVCKCMCFLMWYVVDDAMWLCMERCVTPIGEARAEY